MKKAYKITDLIVDKIQARLNWNTVETISTNAQNQNKNSMISENTTPANLTSRQSSHLQIPHKKPQSAPTGETLSQVKQNTQNDMKRYSMAVTGQEMYVILQEYNWHIKTDFFLILLLQ